MERNSIKFYESSNGAQRFATLTLAFFFAAFNSHHSRHVTKNENSGDESRPGGSVAGVEFSLRRRFGVVEIGAVAGRRRFHFGRGTAAGTPFGDVATARSNSTQLSVCDSHRNSIGLWEHRGRLTKRVSEKKIGDTVAGIVYERTFFSERSTLLLILRKSSTGPLVSIPRERRAVFLQHLYIE